MRKIIVFCCMTILLSCINTYDKKQIEVIYVYENLNDVSDNTRELTLSVLKKRLSKFAPNAEIRFTEAGKIHMLLNASKLKISIT